MHVNVVSASNREENIWDTPSNITVITDQQIRDWGMRDIKDVLRRVAGYGIVADRDEWCFSVRGIVSDNNQKYLILVDGHRIYSIDNFGPGQIIELPNDLSSVKRIEIIRGPGSAVWGSAALAGVINIITKGPEDLGQYMTHTSVTFGEDQTYKSNFQTGQIHDDWDWILMGSFAKSDGHTVQQSAATDDISNGGFPILDSATGFGGRSYGTYRSDLDRNDGGYMLHFKGKKGKYRFNAFAFQTSLFNRHYESKQRRENYLTNEKYFVEGIYEDQLQDWDVTAKLSYSYNNSQYWNKAGLPIRLEKIWKDKSLNASLSFLREFTEKLSFNGGLEYTYTYTGPDDSVQTDAVGAETKTKGATFVDHDFGGYALFDYKINDTWTLTGGTGINYNDGRGVEEWVYSPRAGIICHESDTVVHKFLYSHAFLRPATFQAASSNVDSEDMDQLEYINIRKFGQSLLTTTLYYQELNGFMNISSFSSGYSNSGNYRSKGVEMELTTPLGKDHTLWANGSYGKATAGSFPPSLAFDGRRVNPSGELLSYPELSINAGAVFRFYDKKLFLSPAVRHVASTEYRASPATTQSLDDATYRHAGPFTYLDLNIGYEPNDQLGMYLSFHNLTDITARNHLTIWNGTVEQSGRYVEFKMIYRF